MKQRVFSSFYKAIPLTIIAVFLLQLGFAQVSSSTNYQIQSDSINFGGGFSSSTNFSQESTFGEIATGRASSTNYQLRAGYQQMQEVYIALSSPADVFMTPALGGITGGSSNGSTTVTVTTDSPAGYQLTIEAQNNPAMQSGAQSIPDYPINLPADYTFTTPNDSAVFGYTVDGNDIANYFLEDGGGSCFFGSNNLSDVCWTGLQTTPFQIAGNSNANHPSGEATTLHFRVGIDSGAGIVAGEYIATTTLTALPL